MVLYDEQGKPIEGALAPEEVEERIKEAKEATKAELEAELSPLQEELEEKKQELEQAKTKLEKEKQKEKNFGNVRRKAEEANIAEGKVEELKKEIEGIKNVITEKDTQQRTQEVDKLIKEASGGDEKLAEKIKFHYNTFDKSTETPENRTERINSAKILAGGVVDNNNDSGAAGSGSGRPAYSNNTKKDLSPDQKEVGKKMGLTDKELN